MFKILGTLMVKGLLKTATLFTPTPTSGSLWLWGSNYLGELGDNTLIPKSSPIQTIAGGKNWKQVASCDYYAAGIKTDGTLWLWGDNAYGYLGDNTIIKRSSPVQTIAGGTNWKQVSGGFTNVAAIKTDGTLWTWGRNYHGNLGDDTVDPKSSPVQTVAGGTDWNQVSVGGIHTAAIKTDGTLWCWGRNFTGQLGDDTIIEKSSPVQTIAGGTNWKQVYCGNTHTAAIKTDGTLWCWGYNTKGELGDGTQYIRSSPVQTITYGNDWSKVSCGSEHTAAIKTDGTLWCWGGNTAGELGDNTTINRSSPVQTIAGGTNWKQIAAGQLKCAAIKTDGTLWVWGRNTNGYLGDSTTIDRSSPVQTVAYGLNWIDVSANKIITAIYAETTPTPAPPILGGGALWLWGNNYNGNLGDNTISDKSSPIQTVSNGADWKQVSRSGSATAAIKIDGTLWTWGWNINAQLGDNTTTDKSSPIQTIAGGTDWKQVSVSLNNVSAIKNDGTLWCWGYNANGQLGDNTTIRKSSPVQTIASGTNWKQVSCSDQHMAAIKTDGTLWCWGYNLYGSLGDNTIIDKSSPVQTITYGTDWKQVSCGGSTTVAIKTDGTLWCWGNNLLGTIGDNTTGHKSSPVQTIAYGTNWKQVYCGGSTIASIKTDGTLWCWGNNAPYGPLGDNTIISRSSPVQTITYGTDWQEVFTQGQYTSAIKTDGTLWNWGIDNQGELGDNIALSMRSSPVQTIANGTGWITSSFSSGIKEVTKSGTLWAWGYNNYGDMGDNTTINKSSPVQTIAGGNNWIKLSHGYWSSAAIKSDGTLWIWGSNSYGQLGDNTTLNKSSPIQTITGGTNWSEISRGLYHSGAIKTDGTLWTWGWNSNGQLGDGLAGFGIDRVSSPIQTIAGGTNWKQISCGGNHSASVKTDGTLWIWGANSYGQLGDNTITDRSSPVQTIVGGTDWKYVNCHLYHTAAIKTDGTLWTWGRNNNGQLGDNTILDKSSPVQTVCGVTNWKQVSCGHYNTAAIKTDGTLWMWGLNSSGLLGDNTTTNRSSPVQTVAYGTNWYKVKCDSINTVAIKNDGTLWCWGNNSNGELGDNTITSRSSPVQTIMYGTNWIDVSTHGTTFGIKSS